MILNSTEDIKQYLGISLSFEFDDFSPYIKKAVNTFTRKYVGNLHIELEEEAYGSNADVKNEAREHLRSVLSNFSYFLYMPVASVLMDSSGISVVNSDNRKTAEWWQIKDIKRELLRSGHESMDLLLEALESNPEVFTDYHDNYSAKNNELIVNSADVFSKWHNIFNSRQTFLALQPTLRMVEDQYIHTLICPELIEELKGSVSGNKQKLKVALQKAIVAFTVAKVCNSGLFLLDDKGLRVDFENYMDGRKQSPDYGKTAEQVQNLANDQINNGTQYLIMAKDIITNNMSDFTMCASPLINTGSGVGYSSYDSPGVFGL